MPDTGAPWNIPYVAGTDLVRDWPTDSQELAEAVADALDDASVIKQVVSYVKTDTFTVSGAGSASWAKIGGGTNDLEVSITPSSTASKVLVFAQIVGTQAVGAVADEHIMFSLFRDSTNLSSPTTPSNRTPALTGANQGTLIAGARGAGSTTMTYLDSPSTTSATVYSAQYQRATSGTTYINRSGGDADFNYVGRWVSVIWAMEVA